MAFDCVSVTGGFLIGSEVISVFFGFQKKASFQGTNMSRSFKKERLSKIGHCPNQSLLKKAIFLHFG